MLVRLLLTALFILLTVSPVLAVPPNVVYVDDDYTSESCGGHVWGTDAFASIQEGINAVAEGGIVHVYAGTYGESVIVDKTLSLTGAGAPAVTGIILTDGPADITGLSITTITVGFDVDSKGIINDAVAAALLGGEIKIRSGSYTQSLNIDRNVLISVIDGIYLRLNGSYSQTDGTFTIPAGTILEPDAYLYISGSFTQTAGIFNPNGETLCFEGSGISNLNTLTTLCNLKCTGSGKSVRLGGDLHLSGKLDLGSGVTMSLLGNSLTVGGVFSNEGMIKLLGNESVSLTNDIDSGVWEYTGDGNVTSNTYTVKRFGVGSDWNYHDLIINDTSLPEEIRDIFVPETAGGNNELRVHGVLDISSGKLALAEKVEVLDELKISGGTLDASAGAIAAHSNVTVSAGTLSAPGPVGATARFSIGGSYERIGGAFLHNGGRIVFNETKTGVRTVDQGDGGYLFKDMVFDGESSSWKIAGHDMELLGDLHVTDGTLATDTFKLKIDGTLTVDGGVMDASSGSIDTASVLIAGGAAELKAPGLDSDPVQPRFAIAGNFTNTVGTFTHNSGTLTFDNTAEAWITSGGTEDIKALYSLAHTGTGKLTLAAGNALRVDGDLTNSGGEFDANAQEIRLSGSWVNSNLFTHAEGTVTLCGDAADKTMTPGDTSPFYNLTVDSAAGTGKWILSPSAILQIDSALNTIKGHFDAGNGNITVRDIGISSSGTLTAPGSSGSFNISGNFINAGVFTHNNGTALFDAPEGRIQTLDAGGTGAGKALNNLTHTGAGTLQLDGGLELAANLTNSDGLLNQNGISVTVTGNWNNADGVEYALGGNTADLKVSGNWNNSGTFTHDNGKVAFDDNGKTSVISGETVFSDLSCNTSGKTLKFESGKTQIVEGKLDINGGISEEKSISPVRLRSSEEGSPYTIDNASGEASVFYVDVQDCIVGNIVYASFSRDAGRNTNWKFSMAGSVVAVSNGPPVTFDPGVPDEHSYPDISPNNDYPYIVYGLGNKLMLVGRDGSSPHPIKEFDQGYALTCRFSPDGSRIAVWVAETTLRQIWVIGINTDGTYASDKVVWSHMAERARSNLAWSYNGAYIYFLNYYAGSLQKVKVDNSSVQTVNDFRGSNLTVVDFDIFPRANINHDRPMLVLRKDDGSYCIRVYGDTSFSISSMLPDYAFPHWTGLDPEGSRPVCIREDAITGEVDIGYHDENGLHRLNYTDNVWAEKSPAETYGYTGASGRSGDRCPRWSSANYATEGNEGKFDLVFIRNRQ